MKKHYLSQKSSEEIREYFAEQFDMYHKATQRAYALMQRNLDNHFIHMRAEFLWLSLKGKMDVTAKFKWLGTF